MTAAIVPSPLITRVTLTNQVEPLPTSFGTMDFAESISSELNMDVLY